MLTRANRRPGRALLVGMLILAATLVTGGRASANPATLTDPNDIGGKLDVTAGTVDNTASLITYELTMDPFTAADVSRVTFKFDFNEDGVADNCLRVGQSSSASGLAGEMSSGCEQSDFVGGATASIVSGNTLKVDLPLQTLRDGGLGNGTAYGFNVETRDVVDPSASVPDDIAPDSGFVVHQLGIVCGSTVKGKVKLTQDIAGCGGDGLTVGKNGTKINLNGFKIESAFVGSSTTTGTGVNVNGFKTVSVSNGKISGFSTGIRFVNSNNPKDPKKHSKIKGVTVDGNTTGIQLVGGKYIDVVGSTVRDNRGVGLTFDGAKIKVAGNQVEDNGLDGIQQTAGSATLTSNTSNSNGDASGALNGDGIDMEGTGKLSNNTANNNDGDGINAPNAKKGKGPNTATGNAGTQCDPAALCP